MSQNKRLFVAVDLPPSVIHEIERAQRYFKKKDLFEGRYPESAAMHLTLEFIGEVPEQQLPDIQSALRSIHAEKLTARLDAVSFFGDPENIKIIFIGVTGDGVNELAHIIAQQLSPCVAQEKDQFVAHLTVARVKRVYDAPALHEAIELFLPQQIVFRLDSFVLMESELASDGPTHYIIERYALN